MTTNTPEIRNGSRSNPDNQPVQVRMTPFQIAALKAIASLDGINSAALLRKLVDEHIEYALTQAPVDDRELVLALLRRGGFADDLARIIGGAIKGEMAHQDSLGHEHAFRLEQALEEVRQSKAKTKARKEK